MATPPTRLDLTGKGPIIPANSVSHTEIKVVQTHVGCTMVGSADDILAALHTKAAQMKKG